MESFQAAFKLKQGIVVLDEPFYQGRKVHTSHNRNSVVAFAAHALAVGVVQLIASVCVPGDHMDPLTKAKYVNGRVLLKFAYRTQL